jgi:hypothetical protein
MSSGATTPTNLSKSGKKKKKKSDPNIASIAGSTITTTTTTTNSTQAIISSSSTTNMKSNPNLHILEDFDNIDDFDESGNITNNNNNNIIENESNIHHHQEQADLNQQENGNNNNGSNENDQYNNNSDSNSNSSSNSNNSSSRRLSYKEDDLLRKQRLKENFNQLLIEYKHEEEAQLKKYSKMSSTNPHSHHHTHNTHNSVSASNLINSNNLNYNSNPNPAGQNVTKSAVKSQQSTQQQTSQSITNSSAFRPVTSLTNLLGSSSGTSTVSQHHHQQVINQQSMQSQYGESGAVKLAKTQSASQFATNSNLSHPHHHSSTSTNNTNNSTGNNTTNMLQKEIENGNLSSSTSSTSSVSSSGSTSGMQQQQHHLLGSHHPTAKSLSIMVGQSMDGTTTPSTTNGSTMRKSPHKSTAHMKPPLDLADSSSGSNCTTPTNGRASVEIQIDLNGQKPATNSTSQSNSSLPTHLKTSSQTVVNTTSSVVNNQKPAISNLSGYLWKMKEQQQQQSSSTTPSTNSSSSAHHHHQFDKYWFALNVTLNTLVYWHDKYEQDVGKYPLGKYELTKCCQLATNLTPVNDHLDFKIVFHLMNANGASSAQFLVLRAGGVESKAAWCEAIKHVIEYGLSNSCTKCKPKLTRQNSVPPSSFNASSQSSSLFSTPQTTPTNNGQYTILSGLGTSNGNYHHMVGQQHQQPPPPTPQTPPPVASLSTSNSACMNSNSSAETKGADRYHHKAHSNKSIKNLATSNLGKLRVAEQHVISNEISSGGSSNNNSSSSAASSSASSPASPYLSSATLVVTATPTNDASSNDAAAAAAAYDESILSLRSLCERQASELDEMTGKWERSEAALADVSARLAQTRQTSGEQLAQIRSLTEQLAKHKECIDQQEREIERLKRSGSEAFGQISGSNVNGQEEDANGVSASARGWNKEVKQLSEADARINDVLEKIKDRETSAESEL